MTTTVASENFTGTAVRERIRTLNSASTAARLIAILFFLYALIAVDRFATIQNIKSLLISITIVGIAAVGSAFVTVGGFYFLLSIGAMAAVSSMVFAVTSSAGISVALLCAIATGILAGVAQGYAVGFRRTEPIVTTIAASSIILGLGQLVSGGRIVPNEGDASLLAVHSIAGILPTTVLILILVTAVLHFVMSATTFGRQVRLTGSNRRAADIAGIPTQRVITFAYIIAGGAAGLAGALLAAQSGQGSPQMAGQIDFEVIAAIVVGGIAVAGGRGSVLDALFGAAFIGLISNVLLLEGYRLDIRLVVQGSVLLIAVIAAAVLNRSRK